MNLLHHGADSTAIAQFSGHKNVGSIANYVVCSKGQQRKMSHILQGVSDKSVALVPAEGNGGPPAKKSRLELGELKLSPCKSVMPSASLGAPPAKMPRSEYSQFTSSQFQSSASSASLSGILAGAVIHGGNINISVNAPKNVTKEP